MLRPTPSLTCIIDRIENSKAVLNFFSGDNHQELILPKKYLPRDGKEGDIFSVELLSEDKMTTKHKDLAKEILKEILSGK